jgi:hypothetical protein
MGWPERFRNIRQLANKRLRQKKERGKQDRHSAVDLVRERRKFVEAWAPRVEKVCRQFTNGVKVQMKPYRVETWGRGNIGWRLQSDFGSIGLETWPWLHTTIKPRFLRGLWLQFLGPDGEELVSEDKAKGRKLDHFWELGNEGASSSAYYYWNQVDSIPFSWNQADSISTLCVSGYFMARNDFSEERLASVLEEMGLDLVTSLSPTDFSRLS